MNSTTKSTSEQIEVLANQVQQLIDYCERLKLDNQLLRERSQSLVVDKANLIEKNEMAQHRVESMIVRLKAMESVG